MRGHIIKRYEGSYSVVVNLGRDPVTGKRKQQWVSVKGTKKEAEKKLAELLHQMDTGSFVKPGKINLGEFLQKWLRDYVFPSLSPRTAEGYESIVNRHLILKLGNVPLHLLRPEHLQKYYAETLNSGRCGGGRLSAQTIRHHHTAMHKALQTAVEWGLIARNVADAARLPRTTQTEMRIWDEEEITRFLEAARETPYYALFYTALFTGMRRSELLALRWHDIDFILSRIYVNRSIHQIKDNSYVFRSPKTAKGRRTIAMPPSAILVLHDHHEKQRMDRDLLGIQLSDEDLVFSQPDGRPLRPDTITRAWPTLAARAGVKVIRLHDARHSHASLLLKQGVHPKIVQERLGHSTIAVTLDTYSHVSPGLQEAAAKRFDDAFTSLYNKRDNQAVEKIG
jgi:integrase